MSSLPDGNAGSQCPQVVTSNTQSPHILIHVTQDHQSEDSMKSGDRCSKFVYSSGKILKEKQSVQTVEVIQDLKDERNPKKSDNKVKQLPPEPSATDNDEIILVIEESPSPNSSTSMHSYSKVGSKLKRTRSSEVEQEENINMGTRRKKRKEESAENMASHEVEQVACYKCKYCLFLSLNQVDVANHVQKEHASEQPVENIESMQCPGCSNIFYSQNSLKVHLSEDHNVAQKELEYILKTFKSSDSKAVHLQSSVENQPRWKQQKTQENNEVVSIQESSEGSTSQVSSLERGKVKNETNKVSAVNKSGAEQKKIVVKQNLQELVLTKPSANGAGKIQVCKLSSFNSTNEGCNTDEGEIFPQSSLRECDGLSEEQSSTIHTYCENESTVKDQEMHVIENQSEVSIDADMDMDMNYEMDPIQILNIPMEQQQSEPQEHLIQELSLQESGNGKTLQAITTESGQSFTISCEDIINGISQEEVLDVLYIQQDHLPDGRDSPIMVCFAASPGEMSGNDEDYHVQMESMETEIENQDGHHSDRFILSNCSLDSASFVGSDGKRLVKRGFARKKPVKKRQSRKPKVFKSSRKRNEVSEDPSEDQNEGFKCNLFKCSVRLQSHDNLEYHQRCHVLSIYPEEAAEENEDVPKNKKGQCMQVKRFVCPECAIEVKTWKLMKSHLWKEHSIDMELYTCDQCGYKTPSLSNMRNIHIKIHGSEKPYICERCGKGFKTPKQLQNHKPTHVKNGTEICEICSRVFHTSRLLRNHINTVHNKVRPYMCSECGHTAANRSSLKIHLRQHTGDRPYSCDQCDYTTADHNSLRRHKKRHTGDRPYKCPYCDYACIQSSTYKSHLRSKHPGQNTDLMFSCSKCPFLTVNRDIYLAHSAEHDLAEACGIPYKPTRSYTKKVVKPVRVGDDNSMDEMPIFVSIATNETAVGCETNFENIVQHVSEAIVPGSNFHVLYNSISFSDSNEKGRGTGGGQTSTHEDGTFQLTGDGPALEFVAEVHDADNLLEVDELELKFRNPKTETG